MVSVFSNNFIRFPFLYHTFNSLTDPYVQIKMVGDRMHHYLNMVMLVLTLKEVLPASFYLKLH